MLSSLANVKRNGKSASNYHKKQHEWKEREGKAQSTNKKANK